MQVLSRKEGGSGRDCMSFRFESSQKLGIQRYDKCAKNAGNFDEAAIKTSVRNLPFADFWARNVRGFSVILLTDFLYNTHISLDFRRVPNFFYKFKRAGRRKEGEGGGREEGLYVF
jgi:hypothetical protein